MRILSEKVRARRGRPPKDEVRLVPLTDISYVRQMESWMITTRPRRREPLWAVTDETMRNWLKQAVRRAEATVHFFDSGHTTHLPAQLYHAHALSPPAPESHPGTGWSRDAVRWRFIPECLHWIWLPRWQCLSQATGGMLRRSCVHCLPEVTALPYISSGQQNRHNISWSR